VAGRPALARDRGDRGARLTRNGARSARAVAGASAAPFADVRAPAALEDVEMLMTVFVARLTGVPAPGAEIASLRWWPHDSTLTLAPAVRDHVIPALRRTRALA
jgi:8-oxo-dGTP diphosphatase